MITLKDWFEAIQYKITEGSEYGWKCYGDSPFRLTSFAGWKEGQEGPCSEVIFDTNTQQVFEITASDNRHNRFYRWINPDYVKAYEDEAKSRGVDVKAVFDNFDFIDLEVEEEIIEKTKCIMAGLPYDTRVQVPIELEDEEIFQLMKMAHKYDVTLNEFVGRILLEALNKTKE